MYLSCFGHFCLVHTFVVGEKFFELNVRDRNIYFCVDEIIVIVFFHFDVEPEPTSLFM